MFTAWAGASDSLADAPARGFACLRWAAPGALMCCAAAPCTARGVGRTSRTAQASVETGWIDGIVRAKQPQRVSVVLTREEVAAILARLPERERLMVRLMYGTGLRLMACCRLRVQALDSGYRQITVIVVPATAPRAEQRNLRDAPLSGPLCGPLPPVIERGRNDDQRLHRRGTFLPAPYADPGR